MDQPAPSTGAGSRVIAQDRWPGPGVGSSPADHKCIAITKILICIRRRIVYNSVNPSAVGGPKTALRGTADGLFVAFFSAQATIITESSAVTPTVIRVTPHLHRVGIVFSLPVAGCPRRQAPAPDCRRDCWRRLDCARFTLIMLGFAPTVAKCGPAGWKGCSSS